MRSELGRDKRKINSSQRLVERLFGATHRVMNDAGINGLASMTLHRSTHRCKMTNSRQKLVRLDQPSWLSHTPF